MKRILIVEDDRECVAMLERALAGRGFETQHCYLGGEAIALARTFRPHLAILDVMLGDELGYRVAREIRKDRGLYAMPVLFQSAAQAQPDIDHALEQGGDAYIVKPYRTDALWRQIELMGRLSDSIRSTCAITGFANADRLHKHLDRLIFAGEDFGVLYVHLREASRFRGAENDAAMKKIAFTLGGIVKKTIQNDGFFETSAFHLGGGYFVVAMPGEEVRRFGHCLKERFKIDGAPALVASGVAPDVNANGAPFKLTLAALRAEPGGRTTARRLLESLRSVDRKDEVRTRKGLAKLGHEHWAD
jgi:DNA-binding response OmpR family regulator